MDYVSRTYDPFLDLSLEITRAPTVDRALGAFTAPEVLDGPNRYRCPKNNKLVRGARGRGDRVHGVAAQEWWCGAD